MTQPEPLTDQQLDEIEQRATAATRCPEAEANGRMDGQHTWSGGSFTHTRCEPCGYRRRRGDGAEETAALVAEIRLLRAQLDAEKSAHRFTLRQRNNRSNRLLELRDMALAGDTKSLLAAAKDTLAASRTDHDDCHPAASAVAAGSAGDGDQR